MKRLKKSSFSPAGTPADVYLSLGTNIGDREKNLYDALGAISRRVGAVRAASVYETLPMYVEDQPLFLNTVAHVVTYLSPTELLEVTQDIEAALGRVRAPDSANGPRPIDIDIILFGENEISLPDLVIPHPGIHERAFVLAPLLELDPDLRDPVTGRKYAASLDALDEQGIYYFTMKRYSLQDHGG